jgi:hypothetical protein
MAAVFSERLAWRAGLVALGLMMMWGAVPAQATEGVPPDEFAKITAEHAAESEQFALNNAVATVFHESGHMLVSEFNLPVLGKEEDAVDGLAAILLLEAGNETFETAVQDFANVWFLVAEKADAQDQDLAFWDSHGLDEQRAYNTVCWILGKDPVKFKDFAEESELPANRAAHCPYEYSSLRRSWATLMKPYRAPEGMVTKFEITYAPTSNPRLAYFRDRIMQAGILEIVEKSFSGSFALKDGIQLVAAECGQANAFWQPRERRMTLCYEDVLNSAQLEAQWYIDNPDYEDE